jgi:hypothetical protein
VADECSDYAKVKYEGIYSGIDLVYYGNQRQLEYDFVVAPGADPRRIGFDVRGAKRIRRDSSGELVFNVGESEIRWHRPVVYQEKDGARQLVAARYVVYSTYLGGSVSDAGTGITVDASGNAYVVGTTTSADFPVTEGAFQTSYGGNGDAFVTELNPTGTSLVYSTYLGGSEGDEGWGIALGSSGNVYVAGSTSLSY